MKRKNLFFSILLVAMAVSTTGFSANKDIDLSMYKTTDLDLYYYVPNEDEVQPVIEEEPIEYNLFLGKTYVGFKEALGFKESSGSYTVINELGYMGKYQFGKSTLHMIGIYNPERFIKDSRLQELAFEANISRNKWILRKDIKRFEGRYVGGVKVTESGILAAAHLAGAGNVQKYLRSGGLSNVEDAFGTSLRDYLKKFSGYDTSFIEAKKKVRVL